MERVGWNEFDGTSLMALVGWNEEGGGQRRGAAGGGSEGVRAGQDCSDAFGCRFNQPRCSTTKDGNHYDVKNRDFGNVRWFFMSGGACVQQCTPQPWMARGAGWVLRCSRGLAQLVAVGAGCRAPVRYGHCARKSRPLLLPLSLLWLVSEKATGHPERQMATASGRCSLTPG